MSNRAISK